MNLPTLDGSNRERLLEEIYGACERWREQIARVPWGQIHALAKAAEMGQLLRDVEDIARHLLAHSADQLRRSWLRPYPGQCAAAHACARVQRD